MPQKSPGYAGCDVRGGKKRIPAFDSLPEFSFFSLIAVVVKHELSSAAVPLFRRFLSRELVNNTCDLFFPFEHFSLLVIYPRGEREGLFFVRQIKVGKIR